MNTVSMDPIPIIFIMAIFSLFPMIFILTTSFIKISTVCFLTRESLGIQQIPPNMVIYGLSLVLSFYIMGPVYNKSYQAVMDDLANNKTMDSKALMADFQKSSAPLRTFLVKHTPNNERDFFYKSLKQYWTQDMLSTVQKDDFIILVPAFVVSELTQAFKIGFLIYLPSVIIDIIVSNILLAMGMMMMSPVTISLPLKLLLFISVDGWSRLIHVLLSTY
ncbi:MAG: type III secretion system export apparatus subunit SctR [Bdellovibrionota bacterium]